MEFVRLGLVLCYGTLSPRLYTDWSAVFKSALIRADVRMTQPSLNLRTCAGHLSKRSDLVRSRRWRRGGVTSR